MENNIFNVVLNKENGGVESISFKCDEYKMNWCESKTGTWGVPYAPNQAAFNRVIDPVLESFNEDNNEAVSLYSNQRLRISVKRYFNDRGNFVEEYNFTNVSQHDLFFGKGDLGIFATFNDNYEDAETCLTKRCNTHIWCGENVSYVNALRMGLSDYNLGMIVTKGSLSSYSVMNPPYAKNDRGDFILCLTPLNLAPGESSTLSWELFLHKGHDDFYGKLNEYSNFIDIQAEHQTIFLGEEFYISALLNREYKTIKVNCNGKEIKFEQIDNRLSIIYRPESEGEYRFDIICDDIKTHALLYCSVKLDELLKKRAEFIVKKQQFFKEGSVLEGAYLIYDNESDSLYFNNCVSDHNASRERLGMGIFLATYLQRYFNEEIYNSLKKYIEFVFREFVDTKTGEVFDTIGKDASQVRLYNAPWVCVFTMELYKLTKDTKYLEIMFRVMENYYEKGGANFYPNGLSIAEPVNVLRKAGLIALADKLQECFKIHTENMIKIGINYPKHEVDYEQTIVTPAATFISQMYELTSDERYIKEAGLHIETLERFNGLQPDYHLYETAIRHWDDYWFGKSKMFGDTFPHYWSVLSGQAFRFYGKITGNKEYIKKAENNIRNCLCLFKSDGSASCAYIYPYKINDRRGEFFDMWANDQDFALYFAMKFFEIYEKDTENR